GRFPTSIPHISSIRIGYISCHLARDAVLETALGRGSTQSWEGGSGPASLAGRVASRRLFQPDGVSRQTGNSIRRRFSRDPTPPPGLTSIRTATPTCSRIRPQQRIHFAFRTRASQDNATNSVALDTSGWILD